MSISSAPLKSQVKGRFQGVFQEPAVLQLFFLFSIGAAYATLLLLEPHRNLWFDELLTYYITKAPSWKQLFELVYRFDLNPMPVDYVLRRLSIAIFGDNEIAVRAPSILAFYITSVMLFLYVRRKVGSGYATLAVLVLWYSPLFRYATEARPYALSCMFFSSLLLFCDIASSAERPSSALLGVAASNLGLVNVHGFGLLSLLPFLVAEAWRFRTLRKPDYALWAALLLPPLTFTLYLPLARLHNPAIFPLKFQAALRKIPIFFLHVFQDMGSGMFVALLAAILAPTIGFNRWIPADKKLTGIRIADGVIIVILILNPILLILALIPIHGAFWDRYCITTTMAIYVALVVCIACRLRLNQLAGYTAALVLACVLVTEHVVLPAVHRPAIRTADVVAQIEPSLPLVTASGLTFVEMDHYESVNLVSRLYYLTGRSAAIQYAHATLFEDLVPLQEFKRYFPIRANVEDYSRFTKLHREFLVLGTYDYPEDWLLRKLEADGARLVPIGFYDIPYKDHTVYKVVLPDSALKEPMNPDSAPGGLN
jgi:hypothetical protein